MTRISSVYLKTQASHTGLYGTKGERRPRPHNRLTHSHLISQLDSPPTSDIWLGAPGFVGPPSPDGMGPRLCRPPPLMVWVPFSKGAGQQAWQQPGLSAGLPAESSYGAAIAASKQFVDSITQIAHMQSDLQIPWFSQHSAITKSF